MDIGIIGLPLSGKTTVFNALTRGHADTSGASGSATEMHLGVVKVPDPRLEVLSGMYNPRKVVPAEIKYWDVPGPESLAKSQGIVGKYRNILQGADAFLLVVRAFDNPAVAHPLVSVEPGRDVEAMVGELTFADLEVMERATERLEDGMMKAKPAERPAMTRQLEAVRKAREGLEAGVPLRSQSLTESESAILDIYQLLTQKPVIVVFNTDEDGEEPSLAELDLALPAGVKLGEVCLSAKLEAELALMSEEEDEEFRADLGLDESAMTKVIRTSYSTLGLISFLTVGPDEVRAWSVPEGIGAQEAAGTIHTDFVRGFIRAEVIPYEDLRRCGNIAQGRKEGALRSEGKAYQVRDGDVINFLINV
ncbi:MAG: redox-regulated ATPase YchF [Chloroflexi bacterium]|nr:redox-regulated ATPase YchF [Chloroflexota bacterium]